MHTLLVLKMWRCETSQIYGSLQQRVNLVDRNESPSPHLLLGDDNGGMIQWLLESLNPQMHGSVIIMTDPVAMTGMLKSKDPPPRSADSGQSFIASERKYR